MKFGNETLYRLFVIVADEKSITRASEKLFISQPAIEIPKSEFGIYYMEENKFKELNALLKIIKHNF